MWKWGYFARLILTCLHSHSLNPVKFHCILKEKNWKKKFYYLIWSFTRIASVNLPMECEYFSVTCHVNFSDSEYNCTLHANFDSSTHNFGHRRMFTVNVRLEVLYMYQQTILQNVKPWSSRTFSQSLFLNKKQVSIDSICITFKQWKNMKAYETEILTCISEFRSCLNVAVAMYKIISSI